MLTSRSTFHALCVLSAGAVFALLPACVTQSSDDEKGGAAGAPDTQPVGGSSAASGGQAGSPAMAGSAGNAGSAGAGAGAGGTGGGSGGTSGSGAGTAGTAGNGAGGAGASAGAAGTGGASAGAAGTGGASAGAAGTGAAGGTAGTGGASAGTGGNAGQGGGAIASGWTGYSSPCGGNKINALVFDDASRGYVGCGENANGKGLYLTTDGGKSWTSQPKFGEVRVIDLRRGKDGVLYGAGTHTVEGFSLFRVDEAAPQNLKLLGLYTPSNAAFKSVAIGENAARTDDGKVMVDALVGGAVALSLPGKDFVEYSTLHEDLIDDEKTVSGFAPRRIKTLGNDFYAVGNKINEPATIFLPTKKTSPAYHFVPLQLQPDTQDGEPYDLHVWSPTSMMVVGWDQSYQYPLIFVCNGDPYSKTSWRQVDLLDSGITYKGGVNGLAVSGDRVVLVGTKIPSNDGFVLSSPDKGTTWEDLTPAAENGPIEAMYRVSLSASGSIYAAGGAEAYLYMP